MTDRAQCCWHLSTIQLEGMVVMRTLMAMALLVTSAAALAADKPELKTYSPPDSHCSFSTVGGRKPVTGAYHRGEGAAEAKGQAYCFDQRNCRCQVRYVDLPPAARDLSPREIFERYSFAPWIEKGKLERVGEVETGSHKGDAYLVTGLRSQFTKDSDPESERLENESVVRLRVFIVKNRVYFVSAATIVKKQAAAEPEAEAFLKSFRIVDE